MTQTNSLTAVVAHGDPNPQKLLQHQERNRRYRQQQPQKVRDSVKRYSASDAGQAARQRANARSKAWEKTIRFINQEDPEAIAQRFPFLAPHLDTVLKVRPFSRRSIRESLPADQLERLRRNSIVHDSALNPWESGSK
jgi:hypothetical protein